MIPTPEHPLPFQKNYSKMALLVASLCKSQGENSEGRKGREERGLHDDATTQRKEREF